MQKLIPKYLPFWGLLLTLFLILCGVNYVQYGMFTDGILYAAIAKNMAVGQGTFWFPVFSETSGTFIGHPPLHFFLESLYFRVFGNGYLTERLYCLTSILLLAFMMQRIWRQFFPKYQAFSFVPLLFFIMIEDVYLTYTFNLLECTLTLFTTASFLCVLPILQEKKTNKVFILISFVTALFAAFLSKGPVGLFPLSIFGIGYLALRKPNLKNATFWTLAAITTLAVAIFILLQFESPAQALSVYWQEQVVGSMSIEEVTVEGKGNLRGHRLHILRRWFDKMLPVLIIVLIMIGTAWRQKTNLFRSETAKRSLIFILLGLAGTLPYTLLVKQASYYLIPAYVFWVLGFAAFVIPEVERLIEKINVKSLGFKIFQRIIVVALIIVFGYIVMQFGETGRRDKKLLSDVRKIGAVVPNGTTIFTKNAKPQYSLYHFLERYHDISVDNVAADYDYILLDKGMKMEKERDCVSMKLDLDLFGLYRCE